MNTTTIAGKALADPVSDKPQRQKIAPLVLGKDARCGSYWDEADPQVSRPTYVMIGRDAPDDKLQKIVLRYGYTMEQLRSFRDGQGLNAIGRNEGIEVPHG